MLALMVESSLRTHGKSPKHAFRPRPVGQFVEDFSEVLWPGFRRAFGRDFRQVL